MSNTKQIIETKTGILCDWGEPTIIFKGDEYEAYREIMRHHPECSIDYVVSLWDHPDYVDCKNINGQWFAFRAFEHAEITINEDKINDVGEWQ